MLITGVKGQDRREQNEQIWTKITQNESVFTQIA